MEKTLHIDEKEVKLKSTGATLLRYQMQFHKDALKDIFTLLASLDLGILQGNQPPNLQESIALLANMDVQIFQRIMWVMAKTADSSIPDIMEWLDSFDEFPVLECVLDIVELLLGSLTTVKKNQMSAMIAAAKP